ncbi:MAG TPA: hypothetical protein QGI30_08750, partial [Anaerolineales bacterium]|nr:hypothetical protein [Anaerolineales bacterium]
MSELRITQAQQFIIEKSGAKAGNSPVEINLSQLLQVGAKLAAPRDNMFSQEVGQCLLGLLRHCALVAL